MTEPLQRNLRPAMAMAPALTAVGFGFVSYEFVGYVRHRIRSEEAKKMMSDIYLLFGRPTYYVSGAS